VDRPGNLKRLCFPHVTGPLGNAADSNNVFKSISGTLLYSAVAVVIVILLITYRSPFLWLLPVISSGVALIIAQAVIYLLAAHAGLTVNGLSVGILEVLVFGASTDYALLIVARYRGNCAATTAVTPRWPPRCSAPTRPSSPAPPPSWWLLTLSVAELNSTKSLGPVLAIGVAVGMFVMITLLPALMVSLLTVQAHPRLARADTPGALGEGRLEHRPPGRGSHGSPPPCSWASWSSA
jgi:RND superfamily putative drug exporter